MTVDGMLRIKRGFFYARCASGSCSVFMTASGVYYNFSILQIRM
jgi:hypothetical protein